MVADVFDYYAGAPERLLGDTIPVAGGVDFTFREPLGVVGLITPWNFPIAIASWKLGPALAAGNTVVLKPAELTPLTAVELERIVVEAGIPEGVFNVVVGQGRVVGERIVEHPDVAKVAFTGSTEVGRRIAARAAETIKRVTLELGGKSANVIFADADLEQAAAAAPMAVFGNAGQDCCARSRILVERSALDRFMESLEEAVEAIKVGDPLDDVDRDGPADLRGPARDASRRTSTATRPMAIRGSAPEGKGYWFPPTVLVPGLERRPRRARGDLRPGRLRDPVPRRGGGRPARQRHDLRPVRLGLDSRRRQGPARGARDRDRRALDQLEHLGARVARRSAASSSPARAASWARTRSSTTPS